MRKNVPQNNHWRITELGILPSDHYGTEPPNKLLWEYYGAVSPTLLPWEQYGAIPPLIRYL